MPLKLIKSGLEGSLRFGRYVYIRKVCQMALKDQNWLRRHQHTLVYLVGGGGGACLTL